MTSSAVYFERIDQSTWRRTLSAVQLRRRAEKQANQSSIKLNQMPNCMRLAE